MESFDEHAYEAAKDLFTRARNARMALPSLIDQERDSIDLLAAIRYDSSGTSPNNDKMVSAVARHDALMLKLEQRRLEYIALIAQCESVIGEMEASNDGDAGDVKFLRYYFMQGMTEKDAAEKAGFSKSYRHEKKEIALVHAAVTVRRMGLL